MAPSETAPRREPRLARRSARLLGALVAASFGLIVLGALVRAHGAGLACPDWPLCFGELVPPFDMKVGFEYAHRVLAGAIALATGAAAIRVWRHPRLRAAAGRTLAVALVLLAVQIVLGGLTVLQLLAAWTVTSHLVTGNLFALTLLVASRQLAEAAAGAPPRPPIAAPARVAVLLGAGLLALQIVLGGLVSSTYAGLACPEWPMCSGGRFAPTLHGPVGLHVLHRSNGYLLWAALVAAAALAARAPRLRPIVATAALLGTGQIAVGVLNVLWGLPVEVTGLHSALAAALVLVLTLAVREVRAAPRAAAA